MGSGGPRGLQILLSVADRGRGGFDSHTFPPLVLGLALALACGPGAARCAAAEPARVAAQEPTAPPDSAAAPDTSAARAPAAAPAAGPAGTQPAAPATAAAPARTPGERRRPWHATPFAIMARSAIVPGWGQAANRRWLKAGLVAGVEGWAGVRFVQAWHDVNAADQRTAEALARGDAAGAATSQADYDRAFQRRATAGWVLGIAAVLSMMDAYVDAHFLQFDADFGPDPALPADTTGAVSLPAPSAGLRLAARVAFR